MEDVLKRGRRVTVEDRQPIDSQAGDNQTAD